jgi:TonB-linked SusC/RagA family outer membrane protein
MKLKFNRLLVLLLVLISQISFAQEKTVSGTVSDSNGPLPGANVLLKGTKVGTQTDASGKFKIEAKQGQTLVISFLGMESKEVSASSNMKVKLVDGAATKLTEVFVGAVGIKKKPAAVTSSFSTVSNQELKAANNPDVVRSLVGKVSGLQINNSTNGVNGTNSIRIRSMLSFSGNTEALVVIDNVISSADVLASLPADLVQNVTVLKGAQGVALYGSQGKQGVVLVTTKKGTKSEKLAVTFDSGIDFEDISFVPQRQISYGQGWYGVRDPQENGGWGPLFDGTIGQVGLPDANGDIIEAPYSTRGNDHIKEFYTTGNIYKNNINVNMGGADGYLNVNLGNLRRNFILEGDDLNRNSLVLNAGKKINKLNLGGTFTFINSRTRQANVNAATSRGDYTLLTNLLQSASNIPVGLFKDRGLYGWNGYYQNPFWAKDNNRLNETANFINTGLNAEYEINKHISISYNGSVQLKNSNQISYSNQGLTPAGADGGFDSPSEFFQSNFGSTFYYGDLMANFKYDLNDKIGMKLNVGQNIQYNYAKRVSQGGQNLEIPGLYNINNVLAPANPSTLRNATTESRNAAFFANADLNYEDYLFLNATLRHEGNSVAKKGNQFYTYPSVGVSFIPTKAFGGLKDKSTISNIKLYGNYAKVGSLDPIAPYDILSLAATSTNFPFPGTGNSYNDLTSTTNPNIRPETYTSLEGFLKNRLTLDVAAFSTKTTDLITDASRSTATGLFQQTDNAGTLEAKGIEVDLGFMPIDNENFKWNGRVSYSSSETKVIDAGGPNKVVLFDGGNSQMDGDVSAVVGLPFPYITGTDWTRDASGNVIVDAQGRPSPTSTFKNLGKTTPDYILGFTNSFSYKGIGLSFTMDYRTGHSFLSQTKYNLTWNGHLVESAEFDRNVGFIFPGSVIDNPATPAVGDYIPNTNVLTGGFMFLTGAANRTQAYYGQASNLGAFNLIDATALKVREISLSYSLPKKFLENIGIESFKLSVNARNPFIILAKDNRGYADPEASGQANNTTSNSARQAAGTLTNTSRNGIGFIGDAQYPSTRTFGFSINTTF